MQWPERLKDLLYFRRKEVAGGIVMLVIIAGLVAANIIAGRRAANRSTDTDTLWQAEYAMFEQQCITIDSARHHAGYRHRTKHDDSYFRNNITSPHPFDPNSVDSLTLVRMGFSPYVAGNIMRYRAKGGHYRTAEQFGRTYGLDDEAFGKIKGMLVFEADTAAHKPLFTTAKRDTIVELNNCDTTDLMKLRGIGPYWAGRIVGYRQRLGGYYDHSQLREIENIEPGIVDTLIRHSTVNQNLITPINLNKATLSQLHHHPYITFDQAKAIYNLRRMKIRLENTDEIMETGVLEGREYERLKHYITAE